MERHKAWVAARRRAAGWLPFPMDSDGLVVAAALELTTGQFSERRQVERDAGRP